MLTAVRIVVFSSTTVQREHIVVFTWQHRMNILTLWTATTTRKPTKSEGIVAFTWKKLLRERAKT
jgi:hypothetical protein